MKKFISVLLVLAMASAFFAGCGREPEDTKDPGSLSDASRPDYSDGNVIEFVVYDITDGTVRNTRRNAEWLEKEYCLKIAYTIPSVGNEYLATKALREKYNLEISNLFIDDATTPDFLPALKGTAVAADAVFKQIGPKHLVDLNPYLCEGGILEPYVTYVWGNEGSELGLWSDAREYWEASKITLEREGALYALPRRECEPFDLFLGYSKKALELIDEDFDNTPETWDGFVELLRKFKVAKSGSIPLLAYEARASNILSFVASTYGLDFNEDFSWTQKNGEPLWSYCWDEYLEILKDVRSLAAEELIAVDKKAGKGGVIVNYDFDYTTTEYKMALAKAGSNWRMAKGIAGYTVQQEFARFASYGGQGQTGWAVSATPVHQEGYKAALSGTSMFDCQRQENYDGGYIAIGNRLGKEFALRIMDMLAYCCSDAGFLHFNFGQYGSPFADSLEEAGNYIYDENGKIHTWFDYRMDWDTVEYPLFSKYDSHVEQLGSYREHEEGVDYSEQYGITDTKFWPNNFNTRVGVHMFASTTVYQMRLTAYWFESPSYQGESMSKDRPRVDNQIAVTEHILQGMYMDPIERLGTATGSDMQKKIDTLASLAKQFTVDFLKGDITETAWETYINSLNVAGYMDVYNYYKNAAYTFADEYDESVSSQSDVHSKR